MLQLPLLLLMMLMMTMRRMIIIMIMIIMAMRDLSHGSSRPPLVGDDSKRPARMRKLYINIRSQNISVSATSVCVRLPVLLAATCVLLRLTRWQVDQVKGEGAGTGGCFSEATCCLRLS